MLRKTLFADILFLVFCLASTNVHAGQAEARDVARLNNCSPQKIEIYAQKVGLDAPTIYKVTCQKPKVQDDQSPVIDSVLVTCTGSLCALTRSLFGDAK